jgi:site-specific recombinase XerD
MTQDPDLERNPTEDASPGLPAHCQKSGSPVSPISAASAAGPGPADPEVGRAIERFVQNQRAPRTRVEYEKILRDFVKATGSWAFQELLEITPDRVIDYRNALQARGLSPATIMTRLAAISGFFDLLVGDKHLEKNPADAKLVKRLRVSQVSRTEGLTPDEVRSMIETCDGTLMGLRDRALLMTLFYEGLRRSEASKLNWRDLTTKRGLLEVRDAKNNPYETIRLRPEVRSAIEDFHEVLNRELCRRETKPQDPAFVSLSRLRSFGRRLSPTAINEIVKGRAKAAQIDRRVSAHVMRHACTTAALAAGSPLHQVQRHLRHKDVRTTLRYDRERDVRKNPTLDMMPEVM